MPPCPQCPKISPALEPKKRYWEYASDLTQEMMAVWHHYKVCKAVGRFPKDRLVELCAARIMSAEEKADRTWQGRNVREGMGSVVGDLLQLSRRFK